MRYIGLLMTLVLVSVASMKAQTSEFKKWSEGILSWDDFNGTAVMSASPSHLAVALNTVSEEKVEKGKKVHYRIVAEALMSPKDSYADSVVRTEQQLRYHQLLFDQLELYRRRLQSELNSGINGVEAERRLAHYRTLYKEQARVIADETASGADDKKLQEWEYYTRKNLEEVGMPIAPEFIPGDWSYGIYLGIGGSFPTQDIKENFGNCATFLAGLTLGYKRAKLKADIAYGQPDFKNPNVFGVTTVTPDGVVRPIQGPMNDCATFLSVGTTAGFSLLNSNRVAVTPFAGVHWSGYSWNMANLEWTLNEEKNEYVSKVKNTVSAKLKDLGWMAGIDFDIKLHRYVTTTPFFLTGKREQFTSSVRITPFVMYANYKDIASQGYYLGVSVSYSGIARTLKLK